MFGSRNRRGLKTPEDIPTWKSRVSTKRRWSLRKKETLKPDCYPLSNGESLLSLDNRLLDLGLQDDASQQYSNTEQGQNSSNSVQSAYPHDERDFDEFPIIKEGSIIQFPEQRDDGEPTIQIEDMTHPVEVSSEIMTPSNLGSRQRSKRKGRTLTNEHWDKQQFIPMQAILSEGTDPRILHPPFHSIDNESLSPAQVEKSSTLGASYGTDGQANTEIASDVSKDKYSVPLNDAPVVGDVAMTERPPSRSLSLTDQLQEEVVPEEQTRSGVESKETRENWGILVRELEESERLLRIVAAALPSRKNDSTSDKIEATRTPKMGVDNNAAGERVGENVVDTTQEIPRAEGSKLDAIPNESVRGLPIETRTLRNKFILVDVTTTGTTIEKDKKSEESKSKTTTRHDRNPSLTSVIKQASSIVGKGSAEKIGTTTGLEISRDIVQLGDETTAVEVEEVVVDDTIADEVLKIDRLQIGQDNLMSQTDETSKNTAPKIEGQIQESEITIQNSDTIVNTALLQNLESVTVEGPKEQNNVDEETIILMSAEGLEERAFPSNMVQPAVATEKTEHNEVNAKPEGPTLVEPDTRTVAVQKSISKKKKHVKKHEESVASDFVALKIDVQVKGKQEENEIVGNVTRTMDAAKSVATRSSKKDRTRSSRKESTKSSKKETTIPSVKKVLSKSVEKVEPSSKTENTADNQDVISIELDKDSLVSTNLASQEDASIVITVPLKENSKNDTLVVSTEQIDKTLDTQLAATTSVDISKSKDSLVSVTALELGSPEKTRKSQTSRMKRRKEQEAVSEVKDNLSPDTSMETGDDDATKKEVMTKARSRNASSRRSSRRKSAQEETPKSDGPIQPIVGSGTLVDSDNITIEALVPNAQSKTNDEVIVEEKIDANDLVGEIIPIQIDEHNRTSADLDEPVAEILEDNSAQSAQDNAPNNGDSAPTDENSTTSGKRLKSLEKALLDSKRSRRKGKTSLATSMKVHKLYTDKKESDIPQPDFVERPRGKRVTRLLREVDYDDRKVSTSTRDAKFRTRSRSRLTKTRMIEPKTKKSNYNDIETLALSPSIDYERHCGYYFVPTCIRDCWNGDGIFDLCCNTACASNDKEVETSEQCCSSSPEEADPTAEEFKYATETSFDDSLIDEDDDDDHHTTDMTIDHDRRQIDEVDSENVSIVESTSEDVFFVLGDSVCGMATCRY